MALTAQPRAKLVSAITSFPTVAKGTEEKTKKLKKKTKKNREPRRRHSNTG